MARRMARGSLPTPTCLVCSHARTECKYGSVSGVCVHCGRTAGPIDKGPPSFLTQDLIRATKVNQRLDQFQSGTRSNCDCWTTNIVWARNRDSTTTSLRIALPPKPLASLPLSRQDDIDSEVSKLPLPLQSLDAGASRALLVRRYLLLLCPATFDTSDDDATQHQAFLLAFTILSRLSVLLTDIVASDGLGNDTRADDNMSGLAVLYYCFSDTRIALARGVVQPLIRGDVFKRALMDSLKGIIKTLQGYATVSCASRRIWWDNIGERNISNLHIRPRELKLKLVVEPCVHKSEPLDTPGSADMWRSASASTNFHSSEYSDGYTWTMPASSPLREVHKDLPDTYGRTPLPPRDGVGDFQPDELSFLSVAEISTMTQPVRLSTFGFNTPKLGMCSVTNHLRSRDFSADTEPLSNAGASSHWETPRVAYVQTCLAHTPLTLQDKAQAAHDGGEVENRTSPPAVSPYANLQFPHCPGGYS